MTFFVFLFIGVTLHFNCSYERILYMNFPFFASFIIFIGVFWICQMRNQKVQSKSLKSYLNREHLANETRKKSLDSLNYIQIPTSLLEVPNTGQDQTLTPLLTELQTLSNLTIVNLTGLSNTDLKLAYGPANLQKLTEYDLHYTKLARTLNGLGLYYLEQDDLTLAQSFLEYAVETGSDIRATFHGLATIYTKQGNLNQIKILMEKAESLAPLSSSIIVRMLQEFDQ